MIDKESGVLITDLKETFKGVGLKNGSGLVLREPGQARKDQIKMEHQHLILNAVDDDRDMAMFENEMRENSEKGS